MTGALNEDKLNLLRQRSAEPFIALLADLIAAWPDLETLQSWGARYPGDLGNLIKIMAGLSGYSDKREVEHRGIIAHIAEMGDAEIQHLMRQYSMSYVPYAQLPCVEGKAETVDIPTEKVHKRRTRNPTRTNSKAKE